MLKAAQKSLGLKATCITSDIETFEAAQDFDVILCAHVIEHCADPLMALKVLRRALRPGGVLLLVASKPHWCTALIRLIWRNKAFRANEMCGLLAKDGAEARALAGCLGFQTLRVAGSETGWILVEEWQDMAAFDVYKASAGFVRVGVALGSLMLAPPRSRTFEATLA